MTAVEPTPKQREVLEQLRAGERPEFRPELAQKLRSGIEASLSDLTHDDDFSVRKSQLAQVFQCEGRFLANDDEPFTYGFHLARGTVSHKGLELWAGTTTPRPPKDLAVMAIDRLMTQGGQWNQSFVDWFNSIDEAERAELVNAATDDISRFHDMFTSLPRSWVPVVESPRSASFCDGAITLTGKVDLALGRAIGTRAGVLIIDLKTGSFSSAHLEDLRYYALLETLRTGVPPFRLASLYLDSGDIHCEDVTEDLLWTTVRRVTDGVRMMVELREGRKPLLQASRLCNWCPRVEVCEEAQTRL